MKIKSIELKTVEFDPQGTQTIIKFENGWGASIVKHKFSLGYLDGLWELAVLNSKGIIDYDNPLTNDVLGHLSDEEVNECLAKIAAWEV